MFKTLHDYFVWVFNTKPDRVIFEELDGNISIAASDAWRLIQKLVGGISVTYPTAKRIGIFCANRPKFILSLAAVILSGKSAVILDPRLKKEEFQERCKMADAEAILFSGQSFRVDLPQVSFEELSLSKPSSIPCVPIADGLAYVIFSSGTTGITKTVFISEKNVLIEISALGSAYRFEMGQNHLCVLPLHHASGLFRSVLLPLAAECKVIFGEELGILKFWDIIEAHKISFVQVVPTMLQSLLHSEKRPKRAIRRHLRIIGSASGPLSLEVLDRFEKEFGILIAQGYGLTETTCGAFLNHPDDRTTSRRSSVGRPISGTSVTIIDDIGQSALSGAIGEVVIGGPHVAREIRTRDVVLKTEKDNVINTGDLGWLDTDGYLFLTGRNSEVVNRGGENISPIDVEDALMKQPGIEHAVAFAVPHEYLGNDLIAYVSADGDFVEHRIRRELQKLLPDYMMPTRIVNQPEALSSINLKVSRTRLAQHYNEKLSMPKEQFLKRDISQMEKPRAFRANKNVYIRPLMRQDLESNIYRDNMMSPEIQSFTLAGRFPQSEMELEKYFSSMQLPDAMVFAICESRSNEYVGNLTLRIDWVSRIGEFGRLIFGPYQDKPYSMWAMELLIDYAFNDLGLEKLWGSGANPSSIPSLLKLGFRIEGKQRKHQRFRGEMRDLFLVGLLRNDLNGEYGKSIRSEDNGVAETSEIFTKISHIISSVFGIKKTQVNLEMGPPNVEGWTSLGMVTLWSHLEEEFGVKLSSSDMVAIGNVKDLVDLLERRTS